MMKNPKGSPFQFFGIARLFILKFFLSKGCPSISFIFYKIGCLKIPKGSPIQFFGIVRLFFESLFFLQRVPLQLRQKVDNFGSVPFSAPGARTSGPGAPLGPFFLVFRFSSIVNWHLEVLLLFLSLGYGADLSLSRLVCFIKSVD